MKLFNLTDPPATATCRVNSFQLQLFTLENQKIIKITSKRLLKRRPRLETNYINNFLTFYEKMCRKIESDVTTYSEYLAKILNHITHLDFSWGFSSNSSVAVEFRAVILPNDSLASPKKSFTLSSTVLSSSFDGS